MFLNTHTKETTYWYKFHDLTPWNLQVETGSRLVGFNSKNYDWPMMCGAAQGFSNRQLKERSDEIIITNKRSWQFKGVRNYSYQHIDIMPILPKIATFGTESGSRTSLKIFGGRNSSKKLQDLPIEPSARITPEQINPLVEYCYNDCLLTLELFERLEGEIGLRKDLSEQYKTDLFSKSDAQIAETVISKLYKKQSRSSRIAKVDINDYAGTSFLYTPPRFIHFQTDAMENTYRYLTTTNFNIKMNGRVELPKIKPFKLACKEYQIGLGGIHSLDKPGSYYSSNKYRLVDIDVASYYPAIILNNNYEPVQMKGEFSKIYKGFVDTRLEAKKVGNKIKADGLKIFINGTFGKLGDIYSNLYSPHLLIHVTLTGQLALLMLIEQLGDYCVSANTDGILLYYPRTQDERVKSIVEKWEECVKFTMEWTDYDSYHARDVNNYFAIKGDTEPKKKGIFRIGDLSKNPVNEVIHKAIINFYRTGGCIEQFIRQHPVVQDFTELRAVRGGAIKDGIRYGKTARWYHSTTSQSSIKYQTSGNMVPNTHKSKMVLELPDTMPDDIDYNYYVKEATLLAKTIGNENALP